MAAVLLLVGRGLEGPDVVARLLDIEATPLKPQYSMAPMVGRHLALPTFAVAPPSCGPAAAMPRGMLVNEPWHHLPTVQERVRPRQSLHGNKHLHSSSVARVRVQRAVNPAGRRSRSCSTRAHSRACASGARRRRTAPRAPRCRRA